MTVGQPESYLEHPLFRQAMASLQKGEWEAGLKQFEKLSQAFPLESELRSLRQEMLLRARIDQDEREDNALIRRRRAKNIAIRLVTLGALAVLAFFVVTSYSRWINAQVASARQTLEYQVLTLELAVKFRDAQDYLRGGQTDNALAKLNEIAAIDPNYPGLVAVMEEAQRQKGLDGRYNQALKLAAEGDLNGALELFRALEAEEPFFRDIKTQIQNLERQTILGDMLARADQAFDASDWEQAAAAYEELYVYNPDFETAYVEDRLFTSYVKAAELNLFGSESLEAIQKAEDFYRKALSLRPQDPATKARQEQVRSLVEERLFYGYIDLAQRALAEEPDSLEALNLANQYFIEALKIRPDSPEVAEQGELATKYLQSLEYSEGENWGAAIDNLEYIYSKDPGYAAGTARQALYEAHVARGDEELAIGKFEDALADFQRGAVLAQDDPSSTLRLYEIQLKIAETMGLLGDYPGAVQLYTAAIELTNLETLAAANSAAVESALEAARDAADRDDYREAYLNYREAAALGWQVFEVVEHVVDSGEYLSSIALDYNSTVSLIAAANNLANPNLIITGQTLLIPVLP
jgi:tetratricopeptide (TPR) repeat protein